MVLLGASTLRHVHLYCSGSSRHNGAAGVQCAGHEGAVVSLCMLPGQRRLVASCDSSGTCHVWSSASGARLCCFAEPGNPTVQASHSSSPWGRQHSAGKLLSTCSQLPVQLPYDMLTRSKRSPLPLITQSLHVANREGRLSPSHPR